jgi:Flp pilus assembly protein TadG
MFLRSTQFRRRGVTVVECAVILPVTFTLILGLIVGGMGVFRYQEAAALARAGARYASTHGKQYRQDAGWSQGTAGTPAGTRNGFIWYTTDPTASSGTDTSWTGNIYDSAVRPNIVGLDPASISFQVGWTPIINLPDKPDNWPGSTVSVTVSYQWLPEFFLVGPITLTSTSTMPITN